MVIVGTFPLQFQLCSHFSHFQSTSTYIHRAVFRDFQIIATLELHNPEQLSRHQSCKVHARQIGSAPVGVIFFGRIDMKTEEKFGQGVKFERIRRITGYLVGTMDKWNNAKKAEQRDRVKHL